MRCPCGARWLLVTLSKGGMRYGLDCMAGKPSQRLALHNKSVALVAIQVRSPRASSFHLTLPALELLAMSSFLALGLAHMAAISLVGADNGLLDASCHKSACRICVIVQSCKFTAPACGQKRESRGFPPCKTCSQQS